MANYYNPYNNPMYNPYLMQQYQPPVQQQQTQPTIQQGGFVPVASEKEAMDYLVAQGTSVGLIDWDNKKMYVKTRSFSPTAQPDFEDYDIVKHKRAENKPEAVKEDSFTEFVKKDEIEALQSEIERIKGEIKKLSEAKDDE